MSAAGQHRKPAEGNIRGLTTSEALQRLHDDIERVLREEEPQEHFLGGTRFGWPRKEDCLALAKASLQVNKPLCTFHWISLTLLLLEALGLWVAYWCYYHSLSQSLAWECVFLLLIAALNVALACWDTNLRQTEMRSRVRWIVQFLEEWRGKCGWKSDNYPHIHSPQSPSISLQPTFRDGGIVNLPWALLVRGDVIILRPGQAAPGRCRSLKVPGKSGLDFVLAMDEIYAPLADGVDSNLVGSPQLRNPLPCAYCVLEETPYIQSIRIVLKEALSRPVSVLNQDKYICFTICLEQIAAPAFLVVLLVVNAVRYFYSSVWLSTGHWSDMFLAQPCSVILPLLPLVLPVAWLLINTYGVALILALFYTARQFKVSNDPFEDAEMTSPTHSSFWIKCREMRSYFLDTLKGKGKSPFRTENLFQTLSSVTALCCIDKKGILSWPNPTAEKVFFLRNNQQQSVGKSEEASPNSSPNLSSRTAGAVLKVEKPTKKRMRKRSAHNRCHIDDYGQRQETTAEVLDLSHDCTTPFRLQFDDPSWQQYLGSLKPLGLAILLNTCSPSTMEKYAQFCAHLGCLSLFHEDLVPVTNRREWVEAQTNPEKFDGTRTSIVNNVVTHGCLCELAKQIGFQTAARNIFSLKDQFFTFRHADLARKDRLARSLSMPKLKFPFPNMAGVCVQESISGRHQLLSQGTGEILLDACVDYWDGNDLYPLTMSDRKRILDFYNRSSLTAYCTAFAYRPINAKLPANSTVDSDQLFQSKAVYLELPADSSHLYQPHRSPTPADGPSVHFAQSRILSDGNLYYSSTPGGNPARSNDSLAMVDSPDMPDVESAEGNFQLQCNQTFVGMVTMQYQARTDMVQLIEQLDKASIRFVHFSKENELRSRVFSEKMGLESGWNCHISLLSDSGADSKDDGENVGGKRRHKSVVSLVSGVKEDDNKAASKAAHLAPLEHCRSLSVSAPSAINVDVAQVKFEDEISLHSLTDESDSDLPKIDERERLFHSPPSVKTPSPLRHHLTVACSSEGSSRASLESCSSSSSSSVLINVAGGGSSCWDVNLSRSQSHVTESTEQSAPVTFDFSNRAKLPRGIEEIRPHIENVDNVPLLVSLFTESTPVATREMIKIMQEYGEVVCIVGSSASATNGAIFMQADASLAVEPLYPQVCQQVPVCTPVEETNIISPLELSRRLNSLPCALSFHRDELPSLLPLIMESRHVGICLRNVGQLWAVSTAALSTLQLAAALLFLPPILTAGQIIWLSCITIPLLSISLIGAPTDPTVMNLAPGKNSRKVDKTNFGIAMRSNSLKFLPSMIALLVIYGTTLFSLCSDVSPDCQTATTCVWVYPAHNSTVAKGFWSGWGEPAHRHLLYIIQHSTAMAFVVYLVFISSSFVNRQHHLWQVTPFNNPLWVICSITVIVLQVVYFSFGVWVFQGDRASLSEPCRSAPALSISDIPLPTWLLLVWPLPLIALNELVKHYEIKTNVRLQKRARLEFGTKLGMNSPF